MVVPGRVVYFGSIFGIAESARFFFLKKFVRKEDLEIPFSCAREFPWQVGIGMFFCCQ